MRGGAELGHFLHLQCDVANLPRGPCVIALDRHAVTVEYMLDPVLRDHKQIPLLGSGGIEALIRSKVLPYAPDALIVESDTRIGLEPAWLNRARREVRWASTVVRRCAGPYLSLPAEQWLKNGPRRGPRTLDDFSAQDAFPARFYKPPMLRLLAEIVGTASRWPACAWLPCIQGMSGPILQAAFNMVLKQRLMCASLA